MFFTGIVLLVLVGQADNGLEVQDAVLLRIKISGNSYDGYGYDLEIQGDEVFPVHRYIDPDLVDVFDWDNAPLLIQQLRIGDHLRITRSTNIAFFYKVVGVEVLPRGNVSNFDFCKIQEIYVGNTLPERAKPSDVFGEAEIKLLNQLDNGHWENRQTAFYRIRSLSTAQAQKFLIHGKRFFAKQPEVIHRLNLIEKHLHSGLFDFSYLEYWFNILNKRKSQSESPPSG